MKKRLIVCAACLILILTAGSALAAEKTKINATNFPDANFRAYAAKFDQDKDGALSTAEREAVTKINVANKGITSLKGLKYFPNLKILQCGDNDISALDISQNPLLEEISIPYTNVSSLNLSKCPGLKKLWISGTDMTAADLSKCPKLEWFSCSYSSVRSLNLTANKELKYLYCDYCAISSLNVKVNTKLRELTCSGNDITSLNVAGNTALVKLACDSMAINSLDVTKNVRLETLDCSHNVITSLNVTNNTKLKVLRCHSNRISKLNLTKNTALTEMNVSGNKLTELNLSKNTALRRIECASNSLSKLTLPATDKLQNVVCSYNRLSSLNVSGNPWLDYLNCSSNALTALDLSKNPELTTLYCSYNALTELNLSNNKHLSGLFAIGNRLSCLDVSGLNSLHSCDVFNNQVNLTAEAGMVFLKDLPGFDPAKASGWSKGKITGGNILKVTDSGEVRYMYEIKPGQKMEFRLWLTYQKADVTKATPAQTKIAYTGAAHEPAVTVKAKVSGRTITLKKDTDYTLSYKNNIKAGTATITVKGKGNYKGTVTAEFTITPLKILKLSLSKYTLPYNGKGRTPITTVTAKRDGAVVTLTKGTDYTVAYENNTNAGTGTVTVTGKGNYKGTLTKEFTITPAAIGKVTLESTKMTYTGKALKPKVTVTASVGGKTVTLIKGTDYTVKYENNVNVGTATVTVTGKGNFTGTVTKTFKIVK